MTRSIITSQDVNKIVDNAAAKFTLTKAAFAPEDIKAAVSTPVPTPDDYPARLLKYIPAEIIALFVTVNSLIISVKPPSVEIYNWVIFFALLIVNLIYLWRMMNVNKVSQLAISTVSFAVWVYATGAGPFSELYIKQPLIATLVMIFVVFIIPMFKIGENKNK
jgi:hypothetical protein